MFSDRNYLSIILNGCKICKICQNFNQKCHTCHPKVLKRQKSKPFGLLLSPTPTPPIPQWEILLWRNADGNWNSKLFFETEPGDFRCCESPQTLLALFIGPFEHVERFGNLTCTVDPIRLGGGGGAQRPGWPNSQLPIRNFLTLWLLAFILKTCSDQILAKLINQGVAAALFSSIFPKNLQNEKFSSNWKLLKLTRGSILGREEQFWT